MRKRVSKQVRSSDDEPKHIVYFACYNLKVAQQIRDTILAKTGYMCWIGKINEDVILDHLC